MDRIAEIQARLAAIHTEIDSAEGEALTALETESRNLLNELNTIHSSGYSMITQSSRQAA